MDKKSTLECKSCGADLVNDSGSLATGLCPCCLLADSLHSTIAYQSAKASTPPLEEVSAAFPDLEVIELIGVGGMSAVFKARQKNLDRLVALKLLPQTLAEDPEFTKRFEVEAKALATLNHPNIVTVHDFGKKGDFYYLLMEFVDGPNLRNLISEEKLSSSEALTIIPPLCEALEYAHGKNIVHCDIKPENLLIDIEGRVKVADFGIARILDQNSTVMNSGKVSGTPGYMAPEQRENPILVDARADVYSLGVVFYEMLTGERPGDNLTPPSGKNSSLDVSLDEVVLRALDANPNLRWQSADALNTELQIILTKKSSERKVVPPENLPESGPKRAWLSFACAIFAMLTLIIGSVATERYQRVPEDIHQRQIDYYFDYQLQVAEAERNINILLAIQKNKESTKEGKRELLKLYQLKNSALNAVSFWAINMDGIKGPASRGTMKWVWIAFAVLGLIAFYHGLRYLSWLRGQKDPLPLFQLGIVGASLCPLLLVCYGIFFIVFECRPYPYGVDFVFIVAGYLGVCMVLIISTLVLRKLRAWTQNHVRSKPLKKVEFIIILLISVAVIVPCISGLYGNKERSVDLDTELFHSNFSQENIPNILASVEESDPSYLELIMSSKKECKKHAKLLQKHKLFTHEIFDFSMPEKKWSIVLGFVGMLFFLAIAFFLYIKKLKVKHE